MRRLGIGDLLLDLADVVGDVSVGREDVRQSVEIGVEEEAANVSVSSEALPMADDGASSMKRPFPWLV